MSENALSDRSVRSVAVQQAIANCHAANYGVVRNLDPGFAYSSARFL